jgi:hypothetical protein
MAEAVIQDAEDQLISLVTIFSQEGIQVFHRWCFQWLEAIQFKYRPDGLKNILSFLNNSGRKIAGSLRQVGLGHAQK